jgi:hypothetical protein
MTRKLGAAAYRACEVHFLVYIASLRSIKEDMDGQ